VPIDVLGVNYYSTGTVRRHVGRGPVVRADGHGASAWSAWIGADDVEFIQQEGPYTAMGWNIAPEALTKLLVDLGDTYPDLPLIITENGAAFHDDVSEDGRVHDAWLVAYLHSHISAVHAAMKAGVDLRGYFVWSLMDNFEWGYGFDRRFGVIRIDYDTLERSWKDSAFWYR